MNKRIELPELREHLGKFLGSVSGVCMTFVKLVEPRPDKDEVAVHIITLIEDRYLDKVTDVVVMLVSRYFEYLGLRYRFEIRPVGIEDFRRLHQLDDAWQPIHPRRK